MKILIAEDDPVSCAMLETVLARLGHELVVTRDGDAALQQLEVMASPCLAILDWTMPGRSGPEICREVRAWAKAESPYLILLTARAGTANVVGGFQSGADDYITKPFDPDELEARVNVGVRLVEMQAALQNNLRELQDALQQVKRLRGLLPICAWCKKVRDDRNYWQQVETFVSDHSEARFTHSICPECYEKTLGET